MPPLAQAMQAAGLHVFPCWSRQRADGGWDKGPAVPKGTSWKEVAAHPDQYPTLDWSAEVVGVPIPPGVLVLDVDRYKGITCEQIDAALGVPIPWAPALIQKTLSGGEHYAFRVDFDANQSNDGLPRGLDVRAAGKGFICTGAGYHPMGSGVFAMLYPAALPPLPDALRHMLEVRPTPAPMPVTTQLPYGNSDLLNKDAETVTAALSHLDPGCDRRAWVRVGCALKNHYQDDDAAGFEVFSRWSAGEFWAGGEPLNYVPDHLPGQWDSFKADKENAVHGGTLFWLAMRAGWRPPARFDTAAAFGPGAASVEAFTALVDRIYAEGADSRKTEELLEAVRASGCNDVQALLLRNELKSMLKSAKLLDKDLTKIIDRAISPAAPLPDGAYTGNDTDNAETFLRKHYPGGTLIRCDGEAYRFNGKCWEKLSADMLRHQVAVAMAPARVQAARVSGCYEMVIRTCPTYEGVMNTAPANLVMFNNGVLDLYTGHLGPHSQHLMTTNMLPYDFAPGAQCPSWQAFLWDVFEGDYDRIALLQEWFGYELTNDYRHQKIMLLLGPKRSGKGTIGRVLKHVVGEANFSGGSLTSFADDSFLDSLRTKTVLFIGDAEKRVSNRVISQVIERIKTISGNDEVSFNRKFLSYMTTTLPTRITVASNSVPNLFDDSGALASRLLILPFSRSFYGEEDLDLTHRLLAELPGIAAWSLEGLRRLNTNRRFTSPEVGKAEAEYVQETFSPITRFIDEVCVLHSDVRCTSAEIYEAYRAWCLHEGEELLRRRTFISAIKDSGRGRGVHYGPVRFGNVVDRGFRGIRPALDQVPGGGAAWAPKIVS